MKFCLHPISGRGTDRCTEAIRGGQAGTVQPAPKVSICICKLLQATCQNSQKTLLRVLWLLCVDCNPLHVLQAIALLIFLFCLLFGPQETLPLVQAVVCLYPSTECNAWSQSSHTFRLWQPLSTPRCLAAFWHLKSPTQEVLLRQVASDSVHLPQPIVAKGMLRFCRYWLSDVVQFWVVHMWFERWGDNERGTLSLIQYLVGIWSNALPRSLHESIAWPPFLPSSGTNLYVDAQSKPKLSFQDPNLPKTEDYDLRQPGCRGICSMSNYAAVTCLPIWRTLLQFPYHFQLTS